MAELHTTLLTVGSCRAYEAMTRTGGRWRKAEFPATAMLIRHPDRGAILFDTGYGRAFFEATRRPPARAYRWLTPVRFAAGDALPAQLARHGVGRVELAILSHLHADHVSGLFDLPEPPPALASGAALDHLAGLGGTAALLAGCPPGLRDRLLAIAPRRLEDCAAATAPDLAPFGPARDILGDGSMLAVGLPGHGTGQFGLFLPATRDGPQFLIADAAWSLPSLHTNTPPPRFTMARLGDAAAYLDTFARLRALMARRPDIGVVASHCAETARRLGAAP